MSALTRKLQKIFGSSLTPTGNIGNYGSLAAGTPAYSNDPDAIQTAAWLNGLAAALIGNRSPALEDLNGVLYVLTRQIAYLLQSGRSEWISTETYWTSQVAWVGGVPFISLTDNNTGNNPATDTTNWTPLMNQLTAPTLCRAFAVFDGINESPAGYARPISLFNVTNVSKLGTGAYRVNFANALPSANYTLGGSCGSEDGQPFGAGDSGIVVGNITGQGNAVRSTTQCRLFTIDSNTKAVVQSGCVSVFFFG